MKKFSLDGESNQDYSSVEKSTISNDFHFSFNDNFFGSRALLSTTDIPRNRKKTRVVYLAEILNLFMREIAWRIAKIIVAWRHITCN